MTDDFSTLEVLCSDQLQLDKAQNLYIRRTSLDMNCFEMSRLSVHPNVFQLQLL